MKFFENILFRKKKILENEIKTYLCSVSDICAALNSGVKNYLKGDQGEFEKSTQVTSAGERKADQHLKNIKYNLYANILYPDYQKDITLIFDSMDNVADISNQVLVQISIEQPAIPDHIKPFFAELVDYACKTTSEMVAAAGYLFHNKTMIEDHANKISFYQVEANKTVEKILTKVYGDKSISDLAHKRHIFRFAMKIFSVSQEAAKVAKKLVFYMIKSNTHEEY